MRLWARGWPRNGGRFVQIRKSSFPSQDEYSALVVVSEAAARLKPADQEALRAGPRPVEIQ